MTARLELHQDFTTVDGFTATVSVDDSRITINVVDNEMRHVQRLTLDIADYHVVMSIMDKFERAKGSIQ